MIGAKGGCVDMRVDLGGPEIRMAQQFLNRAQVRAAREKLGGVAVPERMELGGGSCESGHGGIVLPDTLAGKARTVSADEERPAPPRTGELRSSLFQVTLEPKGRLAAEGNEPLLVPLSAHARKPLGEEKVDEIEAYGLGYTQAG